MSNAASAAIGASLVRSGGGDGRSTFGGKLSDEERLRPVFGALLNPPGGLLEDCVQLECIW